jgi:hypothetical protein
MQDWRFDDLTRSLGKATSRRGVLKGLLGGLVGLVVGGSAAAPAAAGVAPTGGCSPQSCRERALQDQINCNRACHALACKRGVGPDGRSNLCLSCLATCLVNFEIAAHECREDGCSGGEQCCSGHCSDVRFDPNNCGSCGHACPAGSTCDGGECSCSDDKTNCNGQCIDTQFDHDNCGGCGNACTGCQTCIEGQCTDSCGSDGYCCNNDHCVSSKCTPPKVFEPSQCKCICPLGGDCGDTCCTGSQECCNGQCVDACPAGQQRDPSTCQCDCSTGEACGPYCCSGDKVCCPDTLSGMSCRDPQGSCGCGVPCGDMCCGQYEFCCRSSDLTYHCVESSGDTC